MSALALSGQARPVVGRARMYVCGVTPYDVTHLGHAATFIWADLAARLLRRTGAAVEVCRNVTDVDDVLFAAAEKAGARYEHVAALQQYHFERDMAALRVRPPEHQPRVHAFIEPVQALAAALLETGAAYRSGAGVYLPAAPVLESAGVDWDTAAEALHGDGAEDPAKADPLDQAVWAPAAGDGPSWPSPWGPGRPGWHAGCAAMALTLLGTGLDVHAGGRDLRFPHHAFETAMAEGATGVRPFSRSWLHVGLVLVEGQRMAKSTGNLVLVEDLLAEHSASVVRLLVLNRPWAQDWDYVPEEAQAAAETLEQLHAAAARPARGEDSAREAAVQGALLADLDVPRALQIALDEGGQAARAAVALLDL